jgi:hypothetical protein
LKRDKSYRSDTPIQQLFFRVKKPKNKNKVEEY